MSRPRGDELVARRVDLRRRHVEGHREDVAIDALPGDGSDLDHPSGRRRELGDAGCDDLADAVGHDRRGRRRADAPALGRTVDHARRDEVPPELDEVERVPAAARRQLGRQGAEVGIERVTDRVGCEALDGGAVEAVEADAADRVDAAEVGETRGQWFRHLVAGVPERADDEHARRQAGPGDVTEEGERLRARPVQILEHDHRRPAGRRLAQRPAERLVQPVAGGVGIHRCRVIVLQHVGAGEEWAQRGQPRCQLADHRRGRQGGQHLLDCLHPGLVRDGQVVVAAAEDHGGAGSVHEAAELRHQPRLAGTRLTTDEDDPPACSGEPPRLLEHCQWRGATDERVRTGCAHRERERRARCRPGWPSRRSRRWRRPQQPGHRRRVRSAPGDDVEATRRAVTGQEPDDVTDEDLAAARRGEQVAGDEDGQAAALGVVPRDVAGCHPDPQVRPRRRRQHLHLDRRGEGVGDGVEHRQHVVGRAGDEPTVVTADDVAELPADRDEVVGPRSCCGRGGHDRRRRRRCPPPGARHEAHPPPPVVSAQGSARSPPAVVRSDHRPAVAGCPGAFTGTTRPGHDSDPGDPYRGPRRRRAAARRHTPAGSRRHHHHPRGPTMNERVFERGHQPTRSSVTGAPTAASTASHHVRVHR